MTRHRRHSNSLKRDARGAGPDGVRLRAAARGCRLIDTQAGVACEQVEIPAASNQGTRSDSRKSELAIRPRVYARPPRPRVPSARLPGGVLYGGCLPCVLCASWQSPPRIFVGRFFRNFAGLVEYVCWHLGICRHPCRCHLHAVARPDGPCFGFRSAIASFLRDQIRREPERPPVVANERCPAHPLFPQVA